MDIFQQYSSLFTSLVWVAHRAIYKPLPDCRPERIFNNYEKSLYNILLKARSLAESDLDYYSLEELAQILTLIWLESDNSFKENKPSVHLKTYLIRRSIWGLRDWLIKELGVVRSGIKYPEIIIEEEKDFTLDLKFLFYGTEIFPFCLLSPYERYLIFLYFKSEKTIVQIADIVQKEEKTIRTQLKSVLNYLRRNVNEKTKSSRLCKGNVRSRTKDVSRKDLCTRSRETTREFL